MENSRVPNWVWAALIGAHVLFFASVLAAKLWNFPDSERYIQAAENLRLHHELYARPWPEGPIQGQAVQEFTIRPVGYPLTVLVTGAADGHPIALLALQNLLSLLNIGLLLQCWAKLARPTPKKWVIALLGILSFPAQLIYANAVMSEVLLQTAVGAMLVAGVLYIQTRKQKYVALGAGFLMVAWLLKPVFYPLTIVFACGVISLAIRQKRVALALIGLMPAIGVGLYMEWNAQRTGYFHFSSIAEINLLHYNAAGVVRRVEGPAAEEKWVAKVLRVADAQPDFASRQEVIQSAAAKVLWAHPLIYALQHVQGMAALFLDPGRFDISQFLGLRPPAGGGLLAQARAGGLGRALGRLPLGLLGGLGLVFLANVARLALAVRGFRRLGHGAPFLRWGRWGAVGLLFYVALLTGPLGAARFLVPVWPLLLGLALFGLADGWQDSAVTGAPSVANG